MGGHGCSWLAGSHQWVGRVRLSGAVNCLYYRYLDGAGKEFKAANLRELVLLLHLCKERQDPHKQLPAALLMHQQPGLKLGVGAGEVRPAVRFPFTFPSSSKPKQNSLQTQLAFSAECHRWGREGKKNYLAKCKIFCMMIFLVLNLAWIKKWLSTVKK